MEKFIKTGRVFYGTALAGIGLQHFIYPVFQSLLLRGWPWPWPHDMPTIRILVWLTGAALITAGAFIIFARNARNVSLVLGGFLLLLFLLFQVPFEILVDPASRFLGLWTNALKTLALSGGAFLIAESFPKEKNAGQKESGAILILEKIMPLGRIFFSIMLICFGIDHFLYTAVVADMVPGWMSAHVFWTYFGGIALVGSGISILLKIKMKLVSILLGSMILIWFIFLHIPGAISDPSGQMGNEVTSAWSALAFSGIAFVIAGQYAQGKRN
jgi:uncharacterized membrane protein YphA (DoxX/SURF4 family)